MAALEAVTSRYPTLEAFLKDKEAKREYEGLLGKYFGRERFPCDGFNEVVDQMRAWMDADASVAERLWTPQKAWQYELPLKRASAKVPERYRFVSTPRRFHAIWLDFSGAGCSEGVCAPLNMRAPGRWAAGLDGSVVFHLEKGSRYTGTSLLLSEVDLGEKRLRLVTPTADSLLREPAHVFEKRGKRKTTLLAEWAKAVKSKTPLAVIEGSDHVYGLAGHKDLGALSAMSFHDPRAQKLMPLLSEKCLTAQKTAAKAGGDESLGMKSAGGGAAPAAGSPAAAAQSVLLALQFPPATAAAAVAPGGFTKGGELEKALGDKLSKSPDPKQRSLAALALGLLGQISQPLLNEGNAFAPSASGYRGETRRPGSGYGSRPDRRPPPRFTDTYSPRARGDLARALRDSSPSVRVQSAFAIASNGGTRVAVNTGPLSQELTVIQPPLQQALREAATAPQLATLVAPPPARSFTSPEGIRDQGIDNLIKEGLPLPPQIKKDVFDRAEKGSTAQKEKSLDQIVHDYTDNTSAGASMKAVKTLEEDLKGKENWLKKAVLAKIETDILENCEQCKLDNINRPAKSEKHGNAVVERRGALQKLVEDGNLITDKNGNGGAQ